MKKVMGNNIPLAEPDPANFLKGVFLGIATVFVSALIAAAGKHLSTQVSVPTIVVFQYGVGFLCSIPWLLKGGSAVLRTSRPGLHIIRGVSGCICFFSYYAALKHLPLVDASLLRTTAPLMVPLVIFVWFRKAIPKAAYWPLILGFLGVLVILRPGQAGISIWHMMGLLSGLGLAVSMVSTRLLSGSEPEARILFYYFVISLVFVAPFFLWNYQAIPVSALPGLIGMGLAMYFTFLMYTRAYAYVKASTLAPTSYFGVVFAGLLDWIIWGFRPDHWAIIGAVMVVVGGLLIVRQRPAN